MLVRTFLYRPRCFRKAPAPRSALRPKRVTLRATQGFAPTGVRELIHQEVGPNQKIKRGQIKLTESRRSTVARASLANNPTRSLHDKAGSAHRRLRASASP